MKLSDYVIDFLAQKGVTHVFGMSGGAAVHLFDSAARHPRIEYVCSQHEQSSAMAADGYARVSGKLGVAITTSGPGATNLLTGVCCSYYDSIPTLMITGQVATYRLKGDRQIRQLGFQETDVTSIYAAVTKYAHQVRDPNLIRFYLEKAYHLAFEGRPGTVLLDIPDDLQRAEVDPLGMPSYTPPPAARNGIGLETAIDQLLELARESRRPVIILGGGLATPRLESGVEELVDRLGIPVLLTWAACDMLPYDHPLRVGPFGVYGPRLGNFTVQNADLVLCLGTRLSQNVTGSVLSSFAREATIVMVDVSQGEMDKFDGRGIDVKWRICSRLEEFVPAMLGRLDGYPSPGYAEWKSVIRRWRTTLPHDRPSRAADDAGYVDAYDFVDQLSDFIPAGEAIFVDTGGNLTWTCNGLRIKRGQKLLSAWNNTPMGYALPAAIGAASHTRRQPVTCIIGDGGLTLCVSELAVLASYKLPVRVIVFNNHGHGIQKQTLETWLEGRYVGVDEASGLAFPDLVRAAQAMGLRTAQIARSSDIGSALQEIYSVAGPIFCNVEINPAQKLYPVLKFGLPLEHQMPLMGPEEAQAQMLIPPYEDSSRRAVAGTAGV